MPFHNLLNSFQQVVASVEMKFAVVLVAVLFFTSFCSCRAAENVSGNQVSLPLILPHSLTPDASIPTAFYVCLFDEQLTLKVRFLRIHSKTLSNQFISLLRNKSLG